jgi:hypothetical protein
VILCGVDRIDTDEVGTEVEEVGDIAGAARWVCQGIRIGRVGGGI